MPRPDPLTPEMVRELEALDRALADEPVGDPALADLEQLVAAVRQDAPKMTPQFLARLEQEREQFPETARGRRWFGGLAVPRLRLMAPAVGVMAAALVAVVVVMGGGGASDDEDSTFSAAPAPATSEESAGGSAGAAPTSRPPGALPDQSATSGAYPEVEADSPAGDDAAQQPDRRRGGSPQTLSGPSSSLAPNVKDRNVERNADLVLRGRPSEVQDISDDVVRTTDRFDGIVVSSDISTGDDGGTSTFDLRIPTDKLDDAITAFSKIADVAERRQGLQDITGSFVSTQDRLSDARAERRGLLKSIANTDDADKLRSLRADLRTLRGRIADLNGQMNALRRRADLATVSVTVRSDASASSGDEDGDGSWTVGAAWDDAGRVLEVAAGVALIGLAVLIPFALLGIPAVAGTRIARRRRREAALDGA